MRVMIVVTHLLGTGHLSRMLTLGHAFRQAGHAAHIVSGGMPAPHLDATGLHLHQLPPVRSDGTAFTRLLDGGNAPVTEAYLTDRRTTLLRMLDEIAPDVLITELFPFGRRVLRDEFIALLAAAQAKGIPALASIRDILAPPSKPRKAAFADEMIETYYDAVLVHGDADVTPLSLSWPVSDTLAPKLRYTGFVAPAPPEPATRKPGTVLVSAGGGAVGTEVFAAATSLARSRPDLHWHLLQRGAGAARHLADNLVLEDLRPDFRTLMGQASLSVSMAGYNTCIDLLQTGTPAVLIPFDANGEVEQSLRADALGTLPGIETLRLSDLDASTLDQAMTRALQDPSRAPMRANMQGAARTVDLVAQLLQENRAHV